MPLNTASTWASKAAASSSASLAASRYASPNWTSACRAALARSLGQSWLPAFQPVGGDGRARSACFVQQALLLQQLNRRLRVGTGLAQLVEGLSCEVSARGSS
jgi:hypothetical protein